MRLNKDFLIHRSGESCVMVAAGSASFNGLIRLNKTAEFIAVCLKEDTTEEKIADAVFEKYDAPRELIEKCVKDVLDKLRSAGAIDE